ncbi:MAG TPA: uroporphyrinogen-III synthase [Rhodanobacteraceae bacterium]|nr:uroporphyrinogen-III synthase [Rhodanobacteraceae bacterium]
MSATSSFPSNPLPLAGAAVVLTRPAGDSAALAARVRSYGGVAVILPGSSLRATDDVDAASTAMRASATIDDWIFASPAAVRFAFRLLPDLRIPRRARVFAPGTGTCRALARHGIAAIAPVERQDSEGLLALPALSRVRGRRIALICAPGGRGTIAAELGRRRARVKPVPVYRRAPPRLTRRHFEALARAPAPLITLLSSGEALRNLCAALPPQLLLRLRRQALIVSSARLLAAARAHGFDTIMVARSASPRDLLAAGVAALARHRL